MMLPARLLPVKRFVMRPSRLALLAGFDPNLKSTYLSDPVQAYTRIGNLVDVLFTIIIFAGAITALIFFILGAIQYGSAGDGPGAQKGRETMTYAVIGLVILGLAYVFITFYNNILPHA